jgi:uncharacterized protein YkwD
MSLLALTMIFTASASAAQAAPCPGATTMPTAANLSSEDDVVVCLINGERTSRGLHALRRDGDLAQAARRQASDMVRRTYFSHVTPGGADLGDRLRAAGYGRGQGWHAGEALGWGTGPRATPAALVAAWLDSPAHRHLLLDPGFRELGVGVATGAPRPGNTGLPGATYAVDFGVIR